MQQGFFKVIYNLLERPLTSKYGMLVQNFLLFNILLNLFVVFGTSFFNLSNNIYLFFNKIETFTVYVFIIELFLRYFVAGYNSQYKGFYGRLKYTFTLYTLIDIIAIIPYFLTGTNVNIFLLRLLRFFRILKLIRMKKILKNFFSISAFATSSIYIQTFVLFVLSVLFIYLFHFFYHNHNTSLMIFLDPPALAETQNDSELFFGIIELIVGLFVGGALISIITETLANITNAIHNGYYPFKDNKHTIIINNNDKMAFILYEINQYYKNIGLLHQVVLFLPSNENINKFISNQKKYSNIEIHVTTGEELNWESYKRININEADSVILLQDSQTKTKHQNIKILRYILMHKNFKNKKLKFIIEQEKLNISSYIYKEIFSNLDNNFFLVQQTSIVENFLNRSIINPDYFYIFSNLLSFHGYEFYTLKNIFNTPLTFHEAYMKLDNGVLLGIKQNNTIFLNPPIDTIISNNDEIIVLMENKNSYTINDNFKKIKKLNLEYPKAYLKERKKICIVGDYLNIDNSKIIQFLDSQSIENIGYMIAKDNDYFNLKFWDQILDKNYDAIILNLEDEYEFLLTLYLHNRYKTQSKFLSSIINIINNPANANLLDDNKHKIILSEKVVAQYMTQIIFNHDIVNIFDEITQSKGNEFYIFEKKQYKMLFQIDYLNLKAYLLLNSMLYIGVFRNNEFILNYKNIDQADKIVVLCMGDENN